MPRRSKTPFDRIAQRNRLFARFAGTAHQRRRIFRVLFPENLRG